MKPNFGIEEKKIYRFKETERVIGFVKVLEIIPGKKGVNTHGYKIVKCLHATDTNFRIAMVKYFKLSSLDNNEIIDNEKQS